jgi:hypothetical protein
VVVASVASFLAILGYEAARLHQGGDPALARTSAKPAAKSKSAARTEQSTPSPESDDGSYGGGQGDYGAGQGYYTPPANDPPTTGSS